MTTADDPLFEDRAVMGVTLTEQGFESLKWLTAFPDLARELIAAKALLREDGSFVIGPASRTADGFFLRARDDWPGWVAVASKVEVRDVGGDPRLKLEMNDGGPPAWPILDVDNNFGEGGVIERVIPSSTKLTTEPRPHDPQP